MTHAAHPGLNLERAAPAAAILELKDDLPAFRSAVRGWIRDVLTPEKIAEIDAAKGEEIVDVQRWWMAERHKAGLAVPHWPVEYGGAGLSLAHQFIISEEFTRANTPGSELFVVSLNHIPGTLIPFGTEEQKRKYLPGIPRGDVWCQGFSEPGAGSDLASLRTRAVRDGDDYVVNGQKIWTSMSMYADYCILLARTSSEGTKHQGITFFLLDMKTPGVEVRPIRESTGRRHFAELFLTDVRIPVSERVGDENEGWSVTMATLSSERGLLVFEATERQHAGLLRFYESSLARDATWLRDDELRREFMELLGEMQALRRQILTLVRAGEENAGSSQIPAAVVKLVSSTLRQRCGDLRLRIGALDGQLLGGDAIPDEADGHEGNAMYDYLESYGFTISGGTNEIMRNIIAERGLGMPR